MQLYIIGPHHNEADKNAAACIENAQQLSFKLWNKGHSVICPHLNFLGADEALSKEQIDIASMLLLQRCDGVVLVKGWEEDPDSHRSYQYAEQLGLLVFQENDIPELHLTESRCPIQCNAFLNAIMLLYRTHLKKNADYSPANILGTGEVGVVVRMWDKMARLMNLFGFNLQVQTCTMTTPREPQNEAIEDSFLDMSCYAIIAKLLRDGEWGR